MKHVDQRSAYEKLVFLFKADIIIQAFQAHKQPEPEQRFALSIQVFRVFNALTDGAH